ncbi:MAG: 1-acyl-sn-glycerol-3-phosphate acyltransferase [Bacteroidales bacterium]|nr:1-acyl-sn-glycerol-3-phosphate acyltransferase [Bacteroidales bacterium]
MVKLILRIYNHFSKRKPLLFTLLAVLSLLLAFSASRINFKEDISAFLPKDHNTDRINYAYQHLNSTNKLLVSVSMADSAAAPDAELMIDAVSHLVEQLEQADSAGVYFRKIDYTVDQQQILTVSQFLVENMPYFLTESDYERMDSLLTEENIALQLSNNKRMLMSPIGMMMKQNIMADPLHFSAPVLSGLRDFQASNQFQLYNDFIFSSDRKEAIITIESRYPISETHENAKLLAIVDHAANNTQSRFEQQIKIHHFGSIAIAVTNADRLKQDSLLSSIIAIVLILSLLIYAFRSAKNLLMMLCSLLFGWLFALGLLSVLRDEVSLIAIGVSSIIIGIAINYPLHFILNNKHERHIPNVIKNIVVPLTIGNITTIGAFLSLMFISGDAMRDLGLFASLLLAGVICFVLIFLPHLLKKKSPTADDKAMEDVLVFKKLLSWKPKRNRWFAWIFIALTVFFCIRSFGTKFDADMQNINYMTETQRADFKKLISTLEQGQQTIYYISAGEDLDKALTAYEDSKAALDSLQTTGMFTKISGLGVYLPSKKMQQQRLARWQTFCEEKKDIFTKIDAAGVENGFKSGAFSRFDDIVNADYEVRDVSYFEPITSSLANNYIANENDGGMVMTLLHTTHTELDALEATLNTINNSFSFDAGTIGRSMVNALSTDFDLVLLICGFVVFAFLIFTLGRIELSLLAFLPLTIGWFWILGIMNICDIRFNIVNIILATFIFGQGDDYTIFMTEGLMYEYAYRRKLLVSYKNSITLSAIVMFIGIGSLILAQHPALRSLAEITIIGMGSVVLMAFLLPPVIFRWLTMRKGKRRLMPITLANIASLVYAFIVFLFGTLVLTVIGFFLFTLGKTTDKKKLRYHRIICWVARFVVVRIPRVKTTYNNFDKTIFDKPAIIISNHQSHLDLMCIMSLSPKLIILTNEWVWNSPFYGRLIKYADFYPVSNGIENNLDKLQSIVEKGYSIMIFPEGTRSEDCSIRRFHRGAFYLAEKLNLDIIPVILHGAGHVLPKKEFMLRKGEIHIHVMPPAPPSPPEGGDVRIHPRSTLSCSSCVVLTPLPSGGLGGAMRRFYAEEYAKIAAEIETADYYSDLVLHNYIYKGPSVERAVRRNLKKNSNYKEIISQLKGKSRVLIENCGYGELPLLLSLVYKNMNVVATDTDADKLELAANCTWVKGNLKYVERVDGEEEFDAVVVVDENCVPLHVENHGYV